MRKLLIFVIILAGLLVAADRIGVVVADHEIAGHIQTAYHLPSKPSVSVHGFPFLTQVISGHYDEIDMSTRQLTTQGVTVSNLTAQLTGVRAPLSDLTGHGSATISAVGRLKMMGVTMMSSRPIPAPASPTVSSSP